MPESDFCDDIEVKAQPTYHWRRPTEKVGLDKRQAVLRNEKRHTEEIANAFETNGSRCRCLVREMNLEQDVKRVYIFTVMSQCAV